MSNGLAIAGVTYALQYYLVNLYHGAGLPFTSPVDVTCLAPDQIQSSLGNLTGPENKVNLFLHQVTHNAAWRNADLPSLGADGKTRLQSPSLALDLHYLLTVYGSDYWQAEALLGYALMMLHDNPVLVRADIVNALTALTTSPEPYPTNPLTNVLGSCGLADQVEMLKITPENLGREEMAWLWTALKADYRPTFPFQVTVVLMQTPQPTTFALPVLSRSIEALPIQFAQLLQVMPPNGQVAAASTDVVIVTGEFLSSLSQVQLTRQRDGTSYLITPSDVTNTSFSFVPNPALAHPPGIYALAAQFLDSKGLIAQSTSPIAFPLAPTLPAQTATVVTNSEGRLVTITFSPNVLEGQDVSLALSAIAPPPPGKALFTLSAPAQPFTGSVASLSFQFPPTLPSGTLLGRLQIDGVPSPIQVNWTAHPPTFTGPIITI